MKGPWRSTLQSTATPPAETENALQVSCYAGLLDEEVSGGGKNAGVSSGWAEHRRTRFHPACNAYAPNSRSV